MTHLVASHAQKQSRHEEKLKTTVTFLKQEGYSDFQTLSLLLGYTPNSRNAVYRILNKLTAQGLIHKHDVAFLDGEIKKTLWGITELGLGQYIQEDDEDYPAFDPYRVKFVTLEHKLMTQKSGFTLSVRGGRIGKTPMRMRFVKPSP
ncbi:hypothetical protein JCM19233_5560 [Vibrio astriarenae]|nr:hypothetical protein JCM19233_5560 [Vibrio sp. C7]